MLRFAVRMLVGDAVKSGGVVLGVLFCAFLITHMLSMVSGMLVRTYALISDIPQAQVWVMDPATEYVDEPAGLPSTALERVRSVEGVEWAEPLYAGSLQTRMPSGRFRAVLVIGVDDATMTGAPAKMISGDVRDLRRSDAVIVDKSTAETLLRMPLQIPERHPGVNMPDFTGPDRALEIGDELLLNDHRTVVVGVADLGPRFLGRPLLYTTYSRALELSPPQRNLLSFVLVKPAEGESADTVARRIQETTGLRARTSREFSMDTLWYYINVSGVVSRIIFMTGLAVFVGVSVSALLLFIFTAENARFYVTFMALGTPTRTIVAMIIVQAVLCGAMGYGLGIGLSATMGWVIRTPAMPYMLLWQTMAFTGVVVMVVSTVSAVLSVLKVSKLDASTVFKA